MWLRFVLFIRTGERNQDIQEEDIFSDDRKYV